MAFAIFTGPLGPDPTPTDPENYVFAGFMSFINSSVLDQTIEPGWIMILKPFQVGVDFQRDGWTDNEAHTRSDPFCGPSDAPYSRLPLCRRTGTQAMSMADYHPQYCEPGRSKAVIVHA